MKKNRKKINSQLAYLAIIIILGVTVIGYTALSKPAETKNYGTIEEKIQAELEAAQAKTTRPDYLPSAVYRNLPAFPSDFYPVDLLIGIGRIIDLVNLEEKYWKQPEFYPLFEENINLIANPSRGRFYGIGYGAYPGDIGTEASPGDDFTVASFFHTSWLVETYQGMKMDVVYPTISAIPNTDLNGTQMVIEQDPEKVKDYFEVTTNPSVFLLESVNPIFGYNWTVRVLVHIKIKPDTPKGTYVVGINPGTPPAEYSQRWVRQYLTKYVDVSSAVIGRPYVRVIVDVK